MTTETCICIEIQTIASCLTEIPMTTEKCLILHIWNVQSISKILVCQVKFYFQQSLTMQFISYFKLFWLIILNTDDGCLQILALFNERLRRRCLLKSVWMLKAQILNVEKKILLWIAIVNSIYFIFVMSIRSYL